MNDKKVLNGDTILSNPTSSPLTRRLFTPRDLDLGNLSKLNHAEWLQQYSEILSLYTPGSMMTPMREGRITRLHWASKWIEHLQKMLTKADKEIVRLKRELEAKDTKVKELQNYIEMEDGR